MALCSNASTVFTNPAMPAAASRWPRLLLTEPMGQECFLTVAEGFRQRRDLYRIAQRSRRSVRFDVGDGFRRHARHFLGCQNRPRLAFDAGSREAHLGGAIVVGCESADDGADLVTVANGAGKRFQDNQGDARAGTNAAPALIEGTAAAVRGKDHAFAIEVASSFRKCDRHASGHR